ncbi:MAG: hypothetical protein ACOC2W_00615 [bacterium]
MGKEKYTELILINPRTKEHWSFVTKTFDECVYLNPKDLSGKEKEIFMGEAHMLQEFASRNGLVYKEVKHDFTLKNKIDKIIDEAFINKLTGNKIRYK